MLREGEPLAPLTTFRLGGSAKWFVECRTDAEVQAAVAEARTRGVRLLVLGGGSNVLVSDEGVDALVLKMNITGITCERTDTDLLCIAGAGESWDALVARTVEEKVWGLENLSGIPGSVGGAVVGNIGAYGAALFQTFSWVEAYDCEQNQIVRLTGAQCAFSYRDSIFKHQAGRYILLCAAFTLRTDATPDLSYKDLAQHLGDTPSPSIEAVRAAVLEIRKGKFPDLTQEGTAGSFFKNPILSKEAAALLMEKYPELPIFTLPEAEGVKVPLAWILDKALGMRGFRVGSARLFERQPLVLVSEFGGTARDVDALAKEVVTRVHDAIGIDIAREVESFS